jgi:hypothetical protein
VQGRQTTFLWKPQHRFVLPLQLILMLLGIGAMWVISQEEPRSHLWMTYLYMLLWAPWLQVYSGPSLRIVADGVLISISQFGAAEYVPLATAELTRRGAYWQLRWPRGRTWARIRLKVDPDLPLERAISESRARAAEGLPLPRTEQEAAKAVPVGTLSRPAPTPAMWGAIGGYLALLALAIWLNQPLFLLPAVALPLLLRPYMPPRRAVLTRSGLWVTGPDQLPARIAPEAVSFAADPGRGATHFHTQHPDHPVLRLHTYQSTALIGRLRKPMQ